MKVSIVNAILNSYEIARRQIFHYNKIELPSDVEVIFVDDGSDPPLNFDNIDKTFNFELYFTNDTRPWTQPAARNFGAERAKGEYCIFTDIDHILSREAIEVARNATADVIRFKRHAGVLNEDGSFTQDWDVLKQYGYNRNRLRMPPHGNSYIFKKSLFLELGGVDTTYVGTGKYPNREEVPLKRKLKKLAQEGLITIIDDDTKPLIYMIPNGQYCGDKDYNPFGLFHDLTRSIRVSRQRQRETAIST